MDNYIKVNLPATEQDYLQGNGEGVYVIVTPEVKEAYNKDEAGTTYNGILDNDSFYYIGLEHGENIPFEMRGELRPVVPYTWLQEHYKINEALFIGTPQEQFENLIENMQRGQTWENDEAILINHAGFMDHEKII